MNRKGASRQAITSTWPTYLVLLLLALARQVRHVSVTIMLAIILIMIGYRNKPKITLNVDLGPYYMR